MEELKLQGSRSLGDSLLMMQGRIGKSHHNPGAKMFKEKGEGPRVGKSCIQELVTRDSVWGVFQEEGWMLARS